MATPYSTKIYQKRLKQFIGDFKSKEILIDGYDIAFMTIQVDIFQTLSGPMTGQILLRDNYGFIHKNPITTRPILGGEIVEIKIDDEVYKMRIYKLSDRKNMNPSTLTYSIKLISEDGYKSIYTKISKAYDVTKYEDVIEDIFRKHMNSKTKISVYEKTEVPECLIVPNKNALDACSWLASRSTAWTEKYQHANYLFFETERGWHYTPYELLLDDKMNVPYSKVGYDTMRVSKENHVSWDKRTEEDIVTFDKYSVIRNFDILDDTNNGLYGSKLVNIDLIDKKEEIVKWDYLKDFYNTEHMSNKPGPVIGKHIEHASNTDQHVNVVLHHKGLFTNENPTKTDPKKWLNSRMSLRQQGEYYKIKGVFGQNPDIRVGMMLNLHLPIISPDGLRKAEMDKYFSGNYLIKKLRRTWLFPHSASIVVELSKDSIERVSRKHL